MFWQYSYELLLQHLHSTQSTTILGIINEHINFQGTFIHCRLHLLIWTSCYCIHFILLCCNVVSPGQPSLISDDPEAVTLTGSSQEAANRTNQKEIHWGVSLLLFLQILIKLRVFLVMLFLYTTVFIYICKLGVMKVSL